MQNKSIKIKRLESQIKAIVAKSLNEETNFLLKLSSITYIDLTNDLSYVKIYLDCINRNDIDKVVELANKKAPFFKKLLASNLTTYKIPNIKFLSDKTIDYVNNIESLIKKIHKGDLENE